MQGLRKTRCARTETWIHRSAEGTDLVSLSGTFQYARHPTYLWCQPSDAGSLAKKKTKSIQNLKTRFCRSSLKTYWKPMKCGHLSMSDGTNAGFGRLYVVALARLWPLSSGIEVKRPVANFGSKFHKPIRLATVTAISGKPTNSSFLKRHTSALAREAGRSIIWNVGITLCANPALVSSEKHCPFPSPTLCTKSLLGFLLFVTTYHLFLNHYQK